MLLCKPLIYITSGFTGTQNSNPMQQTPYILLWRCLQWQNIVLGTSTTLLKQIHDQGNSLRDQLVYFAFFGMMKYITFTFIYLFTTMKSDLRKIQLLLLSDRFCAISFAFIIILSSVIIAHKVREKEWKSKLIRSASVWNWYFFNRS